MKKLLISIILVICGVSVTFGQLKVANNCGRDLKVTIGGDTKTIAFKSVSTFSVRVREVSMDVVDLSNNQKFYLTKTVPGSGRVQIETNDLPQTQTTNTTVQTYQQTSPGVTNTQTTTVPAGVKIGSLSNVFGESNLLDGQNQGISTNGQANTQTGTQIINQPQPKIQTQNQVYLSRIRVEYTGNDRCKVFSNIGGPEWQGLEFKGKVSADVKDNTRNSYNLPVQSGQDLQIGLIFKPGEAINEYANVRKRVNPGDTVFYINEGDIKKMSYYPGTDEREKRIEIINLCKEFNLVFTDPANPSKRISLGYNEKSIAFNSPKGQFYFQVSPQKVSTKENQQTIYLSEQVTEKTNVIKIYDQDVKRCLDSPLKGINLYWEGK